jgi:hypothetical protein
MIILGFLLVILSLAAFIMGSVLIGIVLMLLGTVLIFAPARKVR